jgi:hypothetical protein
MGRQRRGVEEFEGARRENQTGRKCSTWSNNSRWHLLQLRMHDPRVPWSAPSCCIKTHNRRPPRCGVSIVARDEIMLAISLLTAAASACLYVPVVLSRAWVAVWAFGVSLFVFGVAAAVLFARSLWEAA